MLGSVVQDVVGDEARVTVIMPNGADPHEFQPSAKDVEAISKADLVVENGLGLEEGLDDALDQARGDGVPFFTATDHVARALRRPSRRPPTRARAGAEDPHFWMDPLAMRGVVAALGPALETSSASTSATAPRTSRRASRRSTPRSGRRSRPIPPERRKLVTGHESMGYFADRYGFRARRARSSRP